jgi:hypothetical protein
VDGSGHLGDTTRDRRTKRGQGWGFLSNQKGTGEVITKKKIQIKALPFAKRA